ncbi:acetyl-CoA synthetase-like protein [Lichtheimia hyalospora FSU 10163]|nr:acetyl-CoA synthetase-like protein [Lichtheimia hyalospora FSU 10163]
MSATLFHKHTEYHAFINLFDALAAQHKDRRFARYQTANGGFKELNYEQFDRITTNLACRWHSHLASVASMGFIADHSIHYLIAMVAIMKLRPVLMALSPRNSEAANVNLLTKTESKFVMASEKYADMAKRCTAQVPGVHYHIVPNTFDIDSLINEPLASNASELIDRHFTVKDQEKIALIIHSSGTTSFPKPIRLSNRYLFNLVQAIPYDIAQFSPAKGYDSNDVFMAAFPLFHVFGIYTTFSVFMYGASALFFSKIPPTPHEIVSTVEKHDITLAALAPVTLDQLALYLKETGRHAPLQKLKFIEYGGAALKHEIGTYFHDHGINVRSVYGTTEISACAASNHDDEKYWYTLRPTSLMQDYVQWEPFDEKLGTYHLVIKAGSPLMATNIGNRPNGDYATNDIFVEEPANSGYWRHCGRKDDTLVMENGEKTNPTPMEAAIGASPLVKHCTVIGEGRQCTAVLIQLDLEQAIRHNPLGMMAEVNKAVEEANKNAPSHSTIMPQMVYVLPLDKHLPTTDKGTVMRKRAIQTYEDVVNVMYKNFLEGGVSSDGQDGASMTLEQTEIFLAKAAADVLRIKDAAFFVDHKDDSLFDYGLNSLLSIQLRNQIASKFKNVANNFLFEHPSIADMAHTLKNDHESPSDKVEERYQETQRLLEKYLERASVDFPDYAVTKSIPSKHVVLLTGATGSLGSFMLRDMLKSSNVSKVYCLVRGKPDALMGRLRKAFEDRLLDVSLLDQHAEKVEALPMNLTAEYFGWGKQVYEKLRQEVTLVQACAWLLDFNQPVSHFDKECIQGLYRLLQFAYHPVDPMHVHVVSSISATAAMKTNEIPEEPSEQDPHVTMPMGYAHSKYIVEHLFHYLTEHKGFPCIVERMGQVCGDSINGIWNISEQYPLMMIGGASELGAMPDLQTNVIDWLPVDYAARSIFDVMISTADKDANYLIKNHELVFHIVNPTTVTWTDVLNSLKACGLEFKTLPPNEWVQLLSNHQDNSAYRLMSFFESNFNGPSMQMPIWQTTKTVKIAPILGDAPAFGPALMQKHLAYWASVGFYNNTCQ